MIITLSSKNEVIQHNIREMQALKNLGELPKQVAS